MLIVVVASVENVKIWKLVMLTVIALVVSATTTYVFVSMNYFWISNRRQSLTLASVSCTDKRKNQDETDVDCGGLICPKCDHMKVCKTALDCISKVCTSNICQGSFIVVWNVTWSVVFGLVPTCSDGVVNQDETDIDCGGRICRSCGNGQACNVSSDCSSIQCGSNLCQSE